jgi:transcriptional regulator with XRE-family HTH domain
MDEWSIGQRIATNRLRRGLTQEELAGLVGLSLSMVKKIEAGHRPVARFAQLVRFAQVLNIRDLRELTGVPFVLMPDGAPAHPAAAAVLRAMTDRYPRVDSAELDGISLAADVDDSWRTWQEPSTFRYGVVGQDLPVLIRRTHALLANTRGTQGHREALRRASHLPARADVGEARRRARAVADPG